MWARPFVSGAAGYSNVGYVERDGEDGDAVEGIVGEFGVGDCEVLATGYGSGGFDLSC